MPESEKTRETRLRRKAARLGYRLEKSRTRDPDAIDFGLYALFDVDTGGTANPSLANRWVHSWTLNDVENWFAECDAGERRQRLMAGHTQGRA